MASVEDLRSGKIEISIAYKCSICKKPLDVNDLYELNKIDGKIACGDCYYKSLGEEIEKHPIRGPHRSRGS